MSTRRGLADESLVGQNLRGVQLVLRREVLDIIVEVRLHRRNHAKRQR